MIDLEELEQLAKAATPGPWKVKLIDNLCGKPPIWELSAKGSFIGEIYQQYSKDYDATYITAACNAVPELIQRIRELEAEVDLLARKIAFHNNKCNCSIECNCGIDVKYWRKWAREKRKER